MLFLYKGYTTFMQQKGEKKMRALKTMEVDLDKVVNLNEEQAKARYNIGRNSLIAIASKIGADVHIGSRRLFNKKKLDAYFENL